jgi:D-alanyl-D-alanine dipeptidase
VSLTLRTAPLLLLSLWLAPTAYPGVPQLVDFALHAPGARVEIRYAGRDNFLGRAVAGYEAARCLLTPPAAMALAQVEEELQAFGLRLIVYDCYRPQRAVDDFVRWAADPADRARKADYYPRVDKHRLLEEGYIAARSGHSRGSTVDLGLVDAQGELLPMGTPWDFFDPLSQTTSEAVSPPARRHRLLLRAVMEKHGFRNYPAEWWHFTLVDEPLPDTYLDQPVR